MKWTEWADERLEALAEANLDRSIRNFSGPGVVVRDDAGHELVSFASNDYFGLTAHPEVIAASREATASWGAGSGSARLIAGSTPIHTQLESELARWKGEDAALLFSSGYTANLGALTAFATDETLILSDQLNHASIVDACRLSHGEVAIYPHRDVTAVRELLTGAERAIVVTDLVFSMDGDIAPIDDLSEICSEAGALLIVDEAHAALGPHADLSGVEHLRVGTLSKMLGSAGGFVAGPETMIRLLLNAARSFVFTTAGSPGDVAAALAALRILSGERGDELRTQLLTLIELMTPGKKVPIAAVRVKDEEVALRATAELYEEGLLVPAIRPPTVPRGTSRLRISLSAAHSTQQVERLVSELARRGLDTWLA